MVLDFPVAILNVIDPTAPEPLPTSLPPTLTPTPFVTPTPIAQAVEEFETIQLDVSTPVNPLNQSALDVPVINTETVSELKLLAVLPQSSLLNDSFPVLVPNVSVDGSRLISAPFGTEQNILIWDLLTVESEYDPELGTSRYSRVMIASPQGDNIAFTPDEYSTPLQLWSVETQRYRTVSHISTSLWNTVVFSPDGTLLAHEGGILDVNSCRNRFTLDNAGKYFFSPDSGYLAVMTRERVYFYEIQAGEFLIQTPRVEPRNLLEDGIFSPDNKIFVATSADGIQAYSVETGELLFTTPAIDYLARWEIENVIFSADGQYLLALNPQGTLFIWDMDSSTLMGTYDTQGAKGIAFSPDGQLLALGNPLRFVDVQTGETIVVDGNYGGNFITFSPDGTSLLINSGEDTYQSRQSVMVFGIPTDERPAWQPTSTSIRASAINVRSEPDGDSNVVDTVSGDVTVLARDSDGEAVYLADPTGWVWSAPEYINLEESALDSLPVRNEQPPLDG